MATNERTAYVLQHLDFEDLGILGPLVRERGYQVRAFMPGSLPDLADAADEDLLIVLGGPIGVYQEAQYPFLSAEKRVIAQWIAENRPILGVCLGAQLIAEAMGAPVTATGHKEIGFAPIMLTPAGRESVLAPLAAAGNAPVPVLHWHGDQYEIPSGASRLAETPGFPNQAFAVGDRILALQFHLEADHTQIERWLVGHAAELSASGIDPRIIRGDAQRVGPELAASGAVVFGTWLDALWQSASKR